MNRDLINPDLFGNDAGEDEHPEILNEYYLEKPEFTPFFSPKIRLGFVRSRKGMGKSALLRQVQFRRQELNEGELIIYVKASDLVALQDIDTSSPGTITHGWQQRMCSHINLQLGNTIRFAGSDDAMTLVEGAELAGFRNRNLVGALIDRLKVKGNGFELTRQRVEQGDSEVILRRFAEKKDIRVWLLVDDVDATFLNSDSERLKASTFFSACRNLAGTVQGLNIRASVRTDVWAILRQYDEALDKCEQYMLDLKWSAQDSGTILDNKIKAFYVRTHGAVPKFKENATNLIFKEPIYWGGMPTAVSRPIHILSAGRPRWAAQLCRMAAKHAFQLSKDRVNDGDISAIMKEYGQSRLSDMYKEHRHQCAKIEVLVESFAGGPAQYSTTELLETVRKNIIDKFGMPVIDEPDILPREMAVAHFLFKVGFINARDDKKARQSLQFVKFEERPYLLTGRANLDDGLPWEIHPSYRQVLRISGGTREASLGKGSKRKQTSSPGSTASVKKTRSPRKSRSISGRKTLPPGDGATGFIPKPESE